MSEFIISMIDFTQMSGWSLLIILTMFVLLAIKRVENAPTILTTTGILFTFVGIAYGLSGFDVEDIAESIPSLIEGMSFAFYSSIWGMFFGLLAKVWITYKEKNESDNTEGAISLENFYALIKSQSESQLKISETLEKVSGNSEAAMTGLKSLHERIELQHGREMELSREQHKEQITELRDFAQKVSEIGSKQLIEALESVIRDFNTQLNEQFGENFKQLNEAVFKLVEWQEKYRQQLIELKDQYDKSLQAIQGVDSSMMSIKDSCSEIPATMDKVNEFTQLAQKDLSELGSHLEAFAELKERAASAMPEIKEALDEIFKNVQMGVDEATSHHGKLLEQSERMAQNYVEATQTSIDKHSEQQQSILNKQGEIFDDFVSSAHKVQQEIQVKAQEGIKSLVEQIVSASDEHNSILQGSIDKNSEQQKALLSKQSEVFEDFVHHAEAAQKEIIDKTQAGIQSLVERVNKASAEQFDRLQQSAERISKINDSLESITHNVNSESIKLQTAVRNQVDQLIQDIRQGANQAQQEQVQLVRSIFAGVEQQLEGSLKATQEVIQKEVNLVEKALESEISQAMTALGRSLGGITEHMSKEYLRMVEASNAVNRQD